MSDLITLADGSVLDVARYPLPGDLTDATPLNRTQLATAFRVSENTISKWIGQGMPVLSEGQNGVAWEFRLSHCWAWRQHRDEDLRQAKRQGDQLAAQAALAFRNLDDDQAEAEGGLNAKQLRELAEADYHRNRAAELRGDLVRSDRVRTVIQDIFVSVRTSITTLPDFAEREFGLSNADVEKLQRRCNDVLVEIRQKIEGEVDARRGDTVQMIADQEGLGL